MPEWGYWSLFFVVSLARWRLRVASTVARHARQQQHQHAAATAERHHLEPGPAQRTDSTSSPSR
jgi:hypothetical protein